MIVGYVPYGAIGRSYIDSSHDACCYSRINDRAFSKIKSHRRSRETVLRTCSRISSSATYMIGRRYFGSMAVTTNMQRRFGYFKDIGDERKWYHGIQDFASDVIVVVFGSLLDAAYYTRALLRKWC